MCRLTLISAAASAAGAVNEDAWGTVGDAEFGAAWVLDGATSLGDRDYMPGHASDAAWYATGFSAALTQHSLWPVSQTEIFSTALRQMNKSWQEVVQYEGDIPRYALPSAAGIWLRWRDGMLEYTSLGDCRGWLRHADGTLQQLSVLDEAANDDWLNERIQAHQSRGVGAGDMRQTVMADIRAARSRMNTAGGYWIFSVDETTAQQMPQNRMAVESGHVVLVSDGLFRWVDTYHQGTLNEFVDRAIADMPALLAEVRAIESDDNDCKKFPRLKRSDDATGLVLRID